MSGFAELTGLNLVNPVNLEILSNYLTFLVGDAPGRAVVVAGLAARVGVVSPVACNDLMYAINCTI